MAVEIFSWPNLHKIMCQTWVPNHASDRANAPNMILWDLSTFEVNSKMGCILIYLYTEFMLRTKPELVCRTQDQHSYSLTCPFDVSAGFNYYLLAINIKISWSGGPATTEISCLRRTKSGIIS